MSRGVPMLRRAKPLLKAGDRSAEVPQGRRWLADRQKGPRPQPPAASGPTPSGGCGCNRVRVANASGCRRSVTTETMTNSRAAAAVEHLTTNLGVGHLLADRSKAPAPGPIGAMRMSVHPIPHGGVTRVDSGGESVRLIAGSRSARTGWKGFRRVSVDGTLLCMRAIGGER